MQWQDVKTVVNECVSRMSSAGIYMAHKSARFQMPKKWHFERPNLRTDSKNLAKHPPKWLGRYLVHAFRFLGGF